MGVFAAFCNTSIVVQQPNCLTRVPAQCCWVFIIQRKPAAVKAVKAVLQNKLENSHKGIPRHQHEVGRELKEELGGRNVGVHQIAVGSPQNSAASRESFLLKQEYDLNILQETHIITFNQNTVLFRIRPIFTFCSPCKRTVTLERKDAGFL